MFSGALSSLLTMITTMMQMSMWSWVAVLITAMLVVSASSLLFMFAAEAEDGGKPITAKIVGSLILLPAIMLIAIFALRVVCMLGWFKFSPFCTKLLGKPLVPPVPPVL